MEIFLWCSLKTLKSLKLRMVLSEHSDSFSSPFSITYTYSITTLKAWNTFAVGDVRIHFCTFFETSFQQSQRFNWMKFVVCSNSVFDVDECKQRCVSVQCLLRSTDGRLRWDVRNRAQYTEFTNGFYMCCPIARCNKCECVYFLLLHIFSISLRIKIITIIINWDNANSPRVHEYVLRVAKFHTHARPKTLCVLI